MSTLKATNLQHASAAAPAIVLASTGSATAQLSSINDGPIAGARNRIINGGFDIWQRATSQSAAGYGSADRWNLAVAGTCTHSQETSIVPTGAQYALKWTTGASSSYGQVRQFVEQLNVIPMRGQIFTASAYVRSGGTFSGNLVFEIGYNTSSDSASAGGWTTVTTTTSGTVTNSAYAQLKVTFTVPSNAVGLYVAIVPDTAQASGAIAYHSLVQLEPGSVATPYERRSYGQELALCQRYYFRIYPGAGNQRYANGQAISTTQSANLVAFPVQMRSAPTALEQSGTASDYLLSYGSNIASACSAVPTFSSASTLSSLVSSTIASGLTAGGSVQLAANSASSFLAWSAEL